MSTFAPVKRLHRRQTRNFRCKRVGNYSHSEQGRKSSVYETNAEIAQLVEHNLAKVGVASSSLVFRSTAKRYAYRCPGGGMVDALVSGASVERRAGSSPVLGTTGTLFYKNMEKWRNW